MDDTRRGLLLALHRLAMERERINATRDEVYDKLSAGLLSPEECSQRQAVLDEWLIMYAHDEAILSAQLATGPASQPLGEGS